MSRILVASQAWNFDTLEWGKPENIREFSSDDEAFAEACVYNESKTLLESLIATKKGARHDFELPHRERFFVCPLFPGIGRGGGNYIAVPERSLTIEVALE